MFDVSIEFLIDLVNIVPLFVVITLIFNIISDLLFGK